MLFLSFKVFFCNATLKCQSCITTSHTWPTAVFLVSALKHLRTVEVTMHYYLQRKIEKGQLKQYQHLPGCLAAWVMSCWPNQKHLPLVTTQTLSLPNLFSSPRLVLKRPLRSPIRQQTVKPRKKKIKGKTRPYQPARGKPAAAPCSRVQPVPRLHVYSQQAHAQTTQTPPAPQSSHEHSINGLILLPSLSEQRSLQPTRAHLLNPSSLTG